jgi:hypothetical protein
MSTNRSVDPDLVGVTPKKDHCAVTHKLDRPAVTPKKDRSGLCSFTFADGRQCRTPRRAGHSHLCFFHARKEAQSLAAEAAGRDISSFLSGSYVSACDLSSALARLFSAVAQGNLKPKTASTLAYLGQTLVQSIQIAEHEYINAFGTDSWRETVRSSFSPPDPQEDENLQPDHAPHTALPPTSTEFVQRVVAGLQTGDRSHLP